MCIRMILQEMMISYLYRSRSRRMRWWELQLSMFNIIAMTSDNDGDVLLFPWRHRSWPGPFTSSPGPDNQISMGIWEWFGLSAKKFAIDREGPMNLPPPSTYSLSSSCDQQRLFDRSIDTPNEFVSIKYSRHPISDGDCENHPRPLLRNLSASLYWN